jgi:hypothetical protein
MAGEEEEFTQEELDALDPEADEIEGDGYQEGDEEDGDAPRLDANRRKSPQGEEEQPGQVNRSSKRFQTLSNRVKVAEEAAAQTRRELDELRSQNQQRQPSQEDPALEAQRMSMMTESERMQYLFDKSERRNAIALQQQAIIHADQNDHSEFRRRCDSDPRAAKYAGEVERLLADCRKSGLNLRREVLYCYILGQKVANAKKQQRQQRQEGQENIRRQTTKPARVSSDRSGGPRTKSFEERFGDTPI